SLVLLIFFIMTTTGVLASSLIDTPPADSGWVTSDPDLLCVGIDWIDATDDPTKKIPVYSLGWGDKAPENPEDQNLKSYAELLPRLDTALQSKTAKVEVTVKAHRDIPSGVVRRLTVELEKRRVKISQKFTSVSEKN